MATVGSSPFSTARHPTHRRPHSSRYHPYSMVSRPYVEGHLMITVDRRSALGGLEPIIEEPEAISMDGPLVVLGGLPDRDFSDDVVVSDDLPRQSEHTCHEPMQATSGHRRLAAAFVNMMFALRRKYVALLGSADLLKGQDTETK
ncbi:hypothetical protein L226DRAFT_571407 [Lentinus tigrinus ALCF2SS1-7]|uniref:Uncharacterized protein n=1 Tax=Lentinus tigrinus ALCF2SS1-6 TaxID=1328759 RepID=A0A5C2SE62_9APHY|nr:hypothetical protein L227DRAFT_609892 [Lentinus tigrinus ALCF2SS1-6]RPD74526.1 hypothetical protein L226DRAFT_571407 [Lentinus tigrinus ALCF2SS1-7]